MATGQQSGEFSLKIGSFIFTPGAANSVLVQANCEGTATGYGTVLHTTTFVVGKSGTYSVCGATYLDNGDIITFTGQGTHESSGGNKWRTQSVNQNADGRTYNVEGEIDLTARTWTGKFVQRS